MGVEDRKNRPIKGMMDNGEVGRGELALTEGYNEDK